MSGSEGKVLMSTNQSANNPTHPVTGEPMDAAFQDLVNYFVGELPARIDQLQHAADQGDIGAIRTLTHQLKGCAAGYGFAELGKRAGVIEGNIDRTPDHTAEVSSIRSEVDSLVALCRSYCSRG